MRRVLLDCDGVLSNVRRHVVEVMELPIDWSAPGPYEVSNWLPPEHVETARELMSKPEFWMTLPVQEGAQDGVQTMRDRNYELIVLTAPYKKCPLWYDARIHWLEENFRIDQDHVIVGKMKHVVTNADRFLDDKIENVEAWEQENPSGQAFLFTAPHNVMLTRRQRVDWDTLERIF